MSPIMIFLECVFSLQCVYGNNSATSSQSSDRRVLLIVFQTLPRAPTQNSVDDGNKVSSEEIDPFHIAVVAAHNAVCEESIHLAPVTDQTLD